MKTKMVFLFTVAFVLASCESSNGTLDITNADILGTWNLTKQTLEDGEATITVQNQTFNSTFSVDTKDIDATFTFSENPNELAVNGTYTVVTTATILGVTNVEEEIIDTNTTPSEPTSWSLDGNNILFSDGNDLPAIMYVEEFSANFLKLKGEINVSETDNGITNTTSGMLYIELER